MLKSWSAVVKFWSFFSFSCRFSADGQHTQTVTPFSFSPSPSASLFPSHSLTLCFVSLFNIVVLQDYSSMSYLKVMEKVIRIYAGRGSFIHNISPLTPMEKLIISMYKQPHSFHEHIFFPCFKFHRTEISKLQLLDIPALERKKTNHRTLHLLSL